MTAWSGVVARTRFPVELRKGVRGFMFDVDGTLAHRGTDGRAHAQPGALEVLGKIRASGRPLVLFTNASHVTSATVAKGLRKDGIDVSDAELLTPIDSATSYMLRRFRGRRAALLPRCPPGPPGDQRRAPRVAGPGPQHPRRRGARPAAVQLHQRHQASGLRLQPLT